MRKTNLNQELVAFIDEKITIEKVVQEKPEGANAFSDTLVFLFNISPMALHSGNFHADVPALSAVKIHPSTPYRLDMAPGSVFYEICFGQDEGTYLDELGRNHHFRSLQGKEKDEWYAVKDQDLDHILDGEKNANKIVRLNGRILVAPPCSRFKGEGSTSGWHLMYARGSRALGVGSDNLQQIRAEEQVHSHNLIKEFYICHAGRLRLAIGEKTVDIAPGDVLKTESGEFHAMQQILEAPYQGITLQFPSIPGDRTFIK